jgi:hypothetical protein
MASRSEQESDPSSTLRLRTCSTSPRTDEDEGWGEGADASTLGDVGWEDDDLGREEEEEVIIRFKFLPGEWMLNNGWSEQVGRKRSETSRDLDTTLCRSLGQEQVQIALRHLQTLWGHDLGGLECEALACVRPLQSSPPSCRNRVGDRIEKQRRTNNNHQVPCASSATQITVS